MVDQMPLGERRLPDARQAWGERGGGLVGVEVQVHDDAVGLGDRAQDAVSAYAVVRPEALVGVERVLPGVEVPHPVGDLKRGHRLALPSRGPVVGPSGTTIRVARRPSYPGSWGFYAGAVTRVPGDWLARVEAWCAQPLPAKRL